MKVAIYCRVANDDGFALKHQEARLREYAFAHGHEVIEVVSDTGSGLSMERPGIRRMCDMAETGAVDGFLATSVNRYGRNVVDTLNFAREMEAKGVTVIAGDFGPITRS